MPNSMRLAVVAILGLFLLGGGTANAFLMDGDPFVEGSWSNWFMSEVPKHLTQVDAYTIKNPSNNQARFETAMGLGNAPASWQSEMLDSTVCWAGGSKDTEEAVCGKTVFEGDKSDWSDTNRCYLDLVGWENCTLKEYTRVYFKDDSSCYWTEVTHDLGQCPHQCPVPHGDGENPVPEPASMALLALAVGGMGAALKRRKK